jgi:hypothetical protein
MKLLFTIKGSDRSNQQMIKISGLDLDLDLELDLELRRIFMSKLRSSLMHR